MDEQFVKHAVFLLHRYWKCCQLGNAERRAAGRFKCAIEHIRKISPSVLAEAEKRFSDGQDDSSLGITRELNVWMWSQANDSSTTD